MKSKPQSGRDVTRERAHGEPQRIQYNPDWHPGIIKRLALSGHSRAEMAAILGVGDATLAGWFAKYPALDEARVESQMLEANVAWRLYQVAMGEYNRETGEWEGGTLRRSALSRTAASGTAWRRRRCGRRRRRSVAGRGRTTRTGRVCRRPWFGCCGWWRRTAKLGTERPGAGEPAR